MLDVRGVPVNNDVRTQYFTALTTVTNVQWQTWRKPRGISMMQIFCVGGGSGGGGGFSDIAGNARGGGGSGAGSAQTIVTVPAFLMPDVLYVQVGIGGAGNASGGGTAGSGILSYVSLVPDNTHVVNLVAVSGNAAPTGGTAGGSVSPGSAGVAGTAGNISINPFAGTGHIFSIGGQAGVQGGQVGGGIGTVQVIPTTGAVCLGGASGAGAKTADFAGAGFTAVAGSYLSEQIPASPASGSNPGSTPAQIWKPFFSYGGCGGSSSNAGVGGAGGNGAYGAGGGGGGGGTTGGVGGNGGSGIVIIRGW